MTLTPGIIELEAVLSTLYADLPVALSVGLQTYGRLQLERKPGRLVLAAGDEQFTADRLTTTLATMSRSCSPLLPVFVRDRRGWEYPLLMLPRLIRGEAMLVADTNHSLTEAEKRELAEQDWF